MAGSLQLTGLPKEGGVIISPSLLSADVLNMERDIEKVIGAADWLHLDIMDGHFVPNLSYGPSLLKALRKRYPDMFIDVHIMVEPPEAFTEMFLSAGASLLTVHPEATPHIHRVLQGIRDEGVKCGISINPGTPAELIFPVLHLADLVLVMSVNPGYGGQSFIPETLNKVSTLAKWREENGGRYLIQMDGGIGAGNAELAVSHGCDVLVAGSAVFGSSDPAAAVREIRLNGERGRHIAKK